MIRMAWLVVLLAFSTPTWAMEHYIDSVRHRLGYALPGVSVTVYVAGTTNLATLYSDNGLTTKTNPFVSADDGSFDFYAANGKYDMRFSRSGTDFTLPNGIFNGIVLDDPADSNSSRVIQDEATSLPQRNILNFTGAGVTCTDNSGALRTDCTIPGGGGGGGAFSGTLGTTDQAVPRASGTGGATFQAGLCLESDVGGISCPDGFTATGAGTGNLMMMSGTAPTTPSGAGQCLMYFDSGTQRLNEVCNGGATKEYVAAADTQTLTNKSYDAEGTGNTLTLPLILFHRLAWCDNVTATSLWSLPTSGAMGKACLGTSTRFGVLTAADAATSAAYFDFRLPTDWTGNFDATIEYTGDTSSVNNIRIQVSTTCVANGQDLLNPTYNTASAVNNSGPATAGQLRIATLSNISMSNCAAGEHAIFKLERIGADAGDTYTGVAQFFGIHLVYRRAI